MSWSPPRYAADGALEVMLPREVLPTRAGGRTSVFPAYGRRIPESVEAMLRRHDRRLPLRCLNADGSTVVACGTLLATPTERNAAFVLDETRRGEGVSGGGSPGTPRELKFVAWGNAGNKIVEYRGVTYRSLAEARLAFLFTRLGWHHVYEPQSFRFPAGSIAGYEDIRSYKPDFLLLPASGMLIYVEYKPGRPSLHDKRRCLALSVAPALPAGAAVLLLSGELQLAEQEMAGARGGRYDYSKTSAGLEIMRFHGGEVAPGTTHIVWRDDAPSAGFGVSDHSFYPAGWNAPRLLAALSDAQTQSCEGAPCKSAPPHVPFVVRAEDIGEDG